MNFKVRKEYFYALITRICYLCAGMLAVGIARLNEFDGVVYCCFILFFAVYFADKEAERKEGKVLK